MSNENEVYIIEDIHPLDDHYYRLGELVGRTITFTSLDRWPEYSCTKAIRGWNYGFCNVNGVDNVHVFYAVKLRLAPTPPKKSFWQKLLTWSW